MNAKLFNKIFLLILALAIFVRFFKLGEIPVSLYWDETAILIDAKSIAATGQDMHGRPWYQLMYPSYGDYKLPVYIWLAGLSVKVFGASEWAVRLPSALAGVGTVLISGLIAKYLFKNSREQNLQLIQLCTMAMVAFAPWSIMFSRTAFEGHLAQFLVGLSILLAIWAQNHHINQNILSKNTWQTIFFLSLAAAIGALATYTYFSVRFVWPVIFLGLQLFFTVKLFRHQSVMKITLKFLVTSIIPLLVFGALLLPMFRSPLYNASNQYRYSTTSVLNNFDYPVISNQLRQGAGNKPIDRLLYHRHFLLLKELAKNYADHLNLSFLFIDGDANLRHGTGQHGLFLLTMLPFLLYGIFKLFLTNKRTLVVLIIWWLIALLPASVPNDTPHALRSLNALIPISILIGLGLYHSLILSKRHYQQKLFQITLAIISLTIVFNFTHFYNHYFVHYPMESAPEWQYGYKEIAQIINQEKSNVEEIWVNQADDRLYLWILAYGDYTPQEIQRLPREGFGFKQINNVRFANFDWKKPGSNHFKTIVIDHEDDILEGLKNADIKPNWISEIKNYDGTTKFLVVHLGQ